MAFRLRPGLGQGKVFGVSSSLCLVLDQIWSRVFILSNFPDGPRFEYVKVSTGSELGAALSILCTALVGHVTSLEL